MSNTTAAVEIDIFYLLKKLWSRKFLIILVSLLFGTIALLTSVFLLKPSYTASTRIYVVNNQAGEGNLNAQDLVAGDYLVKDYKEIILSNSVIATVASGFSGQLTEEEVKNSISVEIPTNTRVIKLSAESENPETAAALANAVREVASEKIKEVTKVEDVTNVESAEVPQEPSSPNIRRNVILGVLLGGFLTVASIIVKEVLDDRIKRPEDVEEVLGMTLLGVVPNISDLK